MVMQWYRVAALAALVAAGAVWLAGPALAAAPTATLTGPARVVAGQPVTLDASASTGEGLRFAWNFGDGVFEMGGPTAVHVYLMPGTYTVTVDVADAQGQDAIATLTIVVVEGMQQEASAGAETSPVVEPPAVLPDMN